MVFNSRLYMGLHFIFFSNSSFNNSLQTTKENDLERAKARNYFNNYACGWDGNFLFVHFDNFLKYGKPKKTDFTDCLTRDNNFLWDSY